MWFKSLFPFLFKTPEMIEDEKAIKKLAPSPEELLQGHINLGRLTTEDGYNWDFELAVNKPYVACRIPPDEELIIYIQDPDGFTILTDKGRYEFKTKEEAKAILPKLSNFIDNLPFL